MPDSSSPTDALHERAHAIARTAQSIVGKVRQLSLYAALSAVWLWGVVFVLTGVLEYTLVALTAVLIGLAMLLPAGLLYALTLGLNEVMRLPERLAAMAQSGQARVKETVHLAADETEAQRWWRIGKVTAALWKMRGLVIEYKGMLVRYAAAVRLFTLPGVLLLLAALLLSVLQIIGAVLSVPVVVLVLLLFA